MGLDIYVGPLTRYYSFTWQTILQQSAAEGGMEVRIVRPPGFSPPTVEEANAAVLRWRTQVGEFIGSPVAWDESSDGEYHTDKPGWEGHQALRLLALKDEFPDLPAPIRLDRKRVRAADNEPLERRFKEVYLGRQPGFVRRLFGAKAEPATAPARDVHLHAAELWIPVDFPHPLDTEDALGSPRVVGSVPRLRAELEAVNARAIKADDATLEQWSKDGPPEDGNFAELSRFGLASILSLARKADQRRQPMVMDY